MEFDPEDGRITTVYTDRGGQRLPFEAKQVVLATGGLIGKGVRSSRESVYEPIFDCRVSHPEERSKWSREGAFDDHPFARFGVSVDRDMQPLNAEERVEYENLRAAGSVLEGPLRALLGMGDATVEDRLVDALPTRPDAFAD